MLRNFFKNILNLFVFGCALSLNAHNFPKDFYFGVGNAEFQNSGAELTGKSNWSEFEQQKGVITGGVTSGSANNFWHNYRQDIKIAKELGLTMFRFSIDWATIEQEDGVINGEAIKHYHEMIDAIKEAGMEPMVTLHHFTHPLWFEQKGGWVKEENISYFKCFSQRMFTEFSEKIKYWITINEPAIFAFSGYLLGIHAPGKVMSRDAVLVLKNMLQAHVETYKALKALPNGQEAQVGIVHNYFKFTQLHGVEPLSYALTKYFTVVTNTLTMEFFKTGTFRTGFLQLCSLDYANEDAPQSFDFFGLNFYGNPVIGWNRSTIFGPTHHEGQVLGDFALPVDPQGFYDALVACGKLGKPVFVTENGLADAQDDRRPAMIPAYLAALDKALGDGVDVRGYIYWTLRDNYEWHEGWTKLFGLVHRDGTIKDSAYVYKNLVELYSQSPIAKL